MSENQRYSDKELEDFRGIIAYKLEHAREELASTLESLDTTNVNIARDKIKGMDDSSVVEEQENLNFLAIRLKKFIHHLEAALVRIKNKTYGLCRKTGKLINKARLMLVPHATLSVEAKNERAENED